MKYAPLASMLLILGSAWLAGCAGSSSSAKGEWQGSAPRPTISKVLIVGISTNFTQRCAYEYSMASQFSGTGILPFASCDSLTPTDPLTRANIERVAAADHVDAVLTTAVVSMRVGSQQGNTRDTRSMPYYQVTGVGYVTGDLGYYGVPVAFVQLDTTQSIPQITGETHVVTKLFSATDGTLLYTQDLKAQSDDVQSSSSAIETVTGLIAQRLRRDGVIH
jgi:hypothetical protein